jgi:hypothetical protein
MRVLTYLTSIKDNPNTVKPRFTNEFSRKIASRVTNGVSINEHASRQQRLATSWKYRRESVSCLCNVCSLHIPARICRAFSWISLCFVVFYVLLNKTRWDQRSFRLRIFRMTNGLQERIKFVNRGSTVYTTDMHSIIKCLQTDCHGLVVEKTQHRYVALCVKNSKYLVSWK